MIELLKKYGASIEFKGNKYTVEFLKIHKVEDEKDLLKLAKTNKNCVNCIDIFNCTNCTNCINCIDCTNCTDCTKCTDCKDCVNCVDCDNCTNCYNSNALFTCEYCSNSRCKDNQKNLDRNKTLLKENKKYIDMFMVYTKLKINLKKEVENLKDELQKFEEETQKDFLKIKKETEKVYFLDKKEYVIFVENTEFLNNKFTKLKNEFNLKNDILKALQNDFNSFLKFATNRPDTTFENAILDNKISDRMFIEYAKCIINNTIKKDENSNFFGI